MESVVKIPNNYIFSNKIINVEVCNDIWVFTTQYYPIKIINVKGYDDIMFGCLQLNTILLKL